ncbi:zf-HC2 domain-containing protein [Kribbella qitaiheensis]|uniref:Zf-HC2 domain-containing protein n=1 Tax=Kribbella qitaiheensis TaxID=1544730 RepID=A0A7G6WW78_9ACTN|nr:zf-HC2 domain-containing protein [Kribbella qitaiheensis]QNE18243.1 zf-HC2 domain-containing protein [Kribbella qitaiheensis]
MSVTSMWTCHWARRRIQRYLDADPAAPLTFEEVHRLEVHLATCDRCTALTDEYRGVRQALIGWSTRRYPHPAALARLRVAAEQIMSEDAG